MSTRSYDGHYEFEMLTPEGFLIVDDIIFRGFVTGTLCRAEPDVGIFEPWFEDVDYNSIEIRTTKPSTKSKCDGFYQGAREWVALPDDMAPFFTRWFESDRGQEWAQDRLTEDRGMDYMQIRDAQMHRRILRTLDVIEARREKSDEGKS